MRIGGDDAACDAAALVGPSAVGPQVFWITPGVRRWGLGGLEAHLRNCKEQGRKPAVHAWQLGDSLTKAKVEAGSAWAEQVCKDMATLAARIDIDPIWIIQTEWNHGTITPWTGFSAHYVRWANALKAHGGLVAFAPGNWGDLAQLVRTHRQAWDASDIYATQGLYATVRHTDATIRAAADLTAQGIAEMLTAYDGAADGKHGLVTDWAASSWGAVEINPDFPFYARAPTPGLGAQGLQKAAWEGMLELTRAGRWRDLDVRAIIMRSWRDQDMAETVNWFGKAEDHWGVAGKPAEAVVKQVMQA